MSGCECWQLQAKLTLILAVASIAGVVYNRDTHTQTLLQGHCNPIACMSVSADKTVIVTADAGLDSMLVLWDSYTGTYPHTSSHTVTRVRA